MPFSKMTIWVLNKDNVQTNWIGATRYELEDELEVVKIIDYFTKSDLMEFYYCGDVYSYTKGNENFTIVIIVTKE